MPTEVFSAFEEFSRTHQYTIAAVTAFGTLAAVVVSLLTSYFALRASRTRIIASIAFNTIYHSSLTRDDRPTYLSVSIRNVGNMPVSVTLGFFSWKFPFKRGLFTALPLDYGQGDPWIAQKQYPLEIAPRASASFILSSRDMFRENVREILKQIAWFKTVRARFVYARVITEDGKLFRVKLGRGVRKEFRLAAQSATFIDD